MRPQDWDRRAGTTPLRDTTTRFSAALVCCTDKCWVALDTLPDPAVPCNCAIRGGGADRQTDRQTALGQEVPVPPQSDCCTWSSPGAKHGGPRPDHHLCKWQTKVQFCWPLQGSWEIRTSTEITASFPSKLQLGPRLATFPSSSPISDTSARTSFTHWLYRKIIFLRCLPCPQWKGAVGQTDKGAWKALENLTSPKTRACVGEVQLDARLSSWGCPRGREWHVRNMHGLLVQKSLGDHRHHSALASCSDNTSKSAQTSWF